MRSLLNFVWILVRDIAYAYVYSDIFVAIYSYEENKKKKKISIFS